MQRYFIEPEQMSENDVRIAGEDVKHIAKVMRMQVGDSIICSNNNGRVVLCSIENITQETVYANITNEITDTPELPINITIAQALPKGDKVEFVIQKGTELGCAQFVLFQGDRSVVKWDSKKEGKKIERYSKIAKEAAEQAHRSKYPDILSVKSIKELLSVKEFTQKVYAYEEKGKSMQHEGLRSSFEGLKEGDSLLIVIGPEGGLSDNEVNWLEKSGFTAASLGPRVLRTETAALYILAAASFYFEL